MRGFWLDRPTLVTGATGLVGSWLLKRLLNERAAVVCLVRDWVPQSEAIRSRVLEGTNVVRGDLGCDTSQALLERVLGEYEIETVFHLAAQTTVPVANRNPGSTFETNIGGTWRLLEACRRSPTVRQIVVASSDKAYGEHSVLPYVESTPLEGRFPYDASKACSDLLAQAYATTYGLPVAITRCGNFFGGGDLNWNRIVPGTIRSIIRGEPPVIRSDGTLIRDYFYVEDGVDSYLLLAQKLAEDPRLCGQAFNFSYGCGLAVRDLVLKILTAMTSKLEPRVLGENCGEIAEQTLDSAKARKALGWTPRFDLENGLDLTVAWYREFFGVCT